MKKRSSRNSPNKKIACQCCRIKERRGTSAAGVHVGRALEKVTARGDIGNTRKMKGELKGLVCLGIKERPVPFLTRQKNFFPL